MVDVFFSQVSSMENLWFSAKNIPCRSPTKSGAPQVRGIPTSTLAPCAGSGARLVESHRNADGTDGKKVGKYERIWMNMVEYGTSVSKLVLHFSFNVR